MTRRFDVFVSHSSVDKPWVRKLARDLERYGVSVWVAEEQIRPGSLIVDALEQALDSCGSMALVVSPESMASGWVEEEYNRALAVAQGKDRRLPLIPVLLRAVELPGFLLSRDQVDFREPSGYAESVWRLVWGITGEKPAQLIDLQSAPAPAATKPVPARPAPATRSSPNREAALIGLLTELFSVPELQRWIRLSLGAEVFNSLPIDSSLSQLAFDTVLAAQQRGLVNRAMFESLLEERPLRADPIRDVARLYGVTLP
jgi:hypothetical protein